MSLKYSLVAFAALLFPALAFTQDAPFNCSTHGLQHLSRFLDGHPERVQQIAEADHRLENFTGDFARDFEARGGGDNLYVIPVVFHIIHNNGPENISDEQCQDAIRVLNDDYNKLNPDWDQVKEEFLDIVADVGITFRLAGLDPDGNCTSGITRTQSTLTNDGGQDMKDLIIWPRDRYLNIWVANSAQGAAAYTQTPGNVDGFWGETTDGIVSLHTYVGSIGTSSLSHSRTLTHEVGHWINLRHCWGPTNDPGLPENCDMDDNVTDTPNTEGWTSCNRNGATCDSPLDNVENYMEYSYCSKMFTNGQKTRMLAALNSSTADRNNLWTQENLELTGTADPQALCVAGFTSDTRLICSGGQVHFNDQSYHGPTAWQWSFPGGTPSTSNEENPVVTYDAPGAYTVELTVSNGSGSLSTSVVNYITVLASTGAPMPYFESFENMGTELDPAQWNVVNEDNDVYTFSLRSDAAYTGSNSVRMRNQNNTEGNVDELMGPTVDLSQQTAIALTFRYAFARRTSTNDDLLRLYVSSNCGNTWNMRKQLRGSNDLFTVPDQGNEFTPTGQDQWQQAVVTNILSSYLVQDFRFKFWFQSDQGNDLWLDDINITANTVGLQETPGAEDASLTIVPNPSMNDAVAVVSLAHTGYTRVEMMDATGRTVLVLNDGRLAAGTTRFTIPGTTLTKGLYLVRVQQDDAVRVSRFTKN
jgi:PKD repeat protein